VNPAAGWYDPTAHVAQTRSLLTVGCCAAYDPAAHVEAAMHMPSEEMKAVPEHAEQTAQESSQFAM